MAAMRDLEISDSSSAQGLVSHADWDSEASPRPPLSARSTSSSAVTSRNCRWTGPTLAIAASVAAAFAFSLVRFLRPETVEPKEQTVQLGSAKQCCSWNHRDCGHGGEYCQTGEWACKKCKGAWGNFEDPCTYGHPPAPPLPYIWPFQGQNPLKIKVMSYNLEWWATGGGQAPQVIKKSTGKTEYDFMGFQECNDPWNVVWRAGLQHTHKALHVNRGPAVDICMVWRNKTWDLIGQGAEQVADDAKYGGRWAMWGRFQHRISKEIVFFMNHHGPLPLNSGGVEGGASLASKLLALVTNQARQGDAVVVVGDFNADGGSLTVRQLECKLSHVAWGDKYNGVDNVFANVQFSHIDDGHGSTLFGGNSDHNALMVVIDLAKGHKKHGHDDHDDDHDETAHHNESSQENSTTTTQEDEIAKERRLRA